MNMERSVGHIAGVAEGPVTLLVSTSSSPMMFNHIRHRLKDYRYLQVFYPTRGILEWYDRAAGKRQPLPGADESNTAPAG